MRCLLPSLHARTAAPHCHCGDSWHPLAHSLAPRLLPVPLCRRWEALIQFLLYIGYVTVMAYNVPLYKCTSRCFGAR